MHEGVASKPNEITKNNGRVAEGQEGGEGGARRRSLLARKKTESEGQANREGSVVHEGVASKPDKITKDARAIGPDVRAER